MAEQEQRVLGDRYEIHQRLARGGMAQVYLARDRSLDRPVAVKELVPEFATDPSFVERFRREAQAAANLSHPNIVGVYDWGTQDGTYFIVMEYVDGPSLSQVIRRDGPLHPRRAAEIANEVAAALGFAHSRGVVHRDVKPGNVLLTATGQSKVTDFGIARALSSPDDDLTQAGSVMGTATYFSPEQAQGLTVDPRSDLYSLGVVLYEMVTGRPPFSGETPLAIAYKHVQDQPAPPSTIVPDIPHGLEAIIMKLLQKKPDDRYPSAEALRADLNRFLDGDVTSAERALVGAAVGAGAVAAAATTVQAAVGPDPDEPLDAVDDPEEDQPRSRTGVFLAVIVVLLVILAALLFWFASSLSSDTVEVPATIGLTRTEAEKLLEEQGFEVQVTEEPNATVEAGRVISQDPAAQTEVDKGSTVKLVVSSGVEQVEVPDVVGRTQPEAQFILTQEGFKFTVTEVENEDAASGTVLSQDPPAGEQRQRDSVVNLEVAKAPGEETIPDVAGQTLQAAQAQLQAAGFRVGGPKQEASATVPAGRVISTDPAGGTAAKKGATVTITVSTGVEQVTVPNVVGQTETNATNTLQSRGFDVDTSTKAVSAGDPNVGRVISQDPASGNKADKGATVKIVVGVAAATTTTASTTTTAP
ncbi:Stk1 family PASTA domain-containing Ser/Thr kinase [Dermatobacter hominis]|uniref:Stk1 family PASTA domain-containing Ser/Thr kinase n=1 Tax=Dermatobacter hominis TaxID=2884263 RepID=UPI001D1289A4|nr:Stk1 family PASTA domain-containing Ser/Thr kinase [Dermatobacter hominis]UDY34245.1 Stk1 family PASTA domain-containing Ser/Thr kinase [Dermatobacter hominis]